MNMVGGAHYQKLKVKEALAVAMEAKKIIDGLRQDQRNDLYGQHRNGNLQ